MLLKIMKYLILLFAFSISLQILADKTHRVGHRNFKEAKKVLQQVYFGLDEEFYCGCKYTGKSVNFDSCGYVPRRNLQRASRIEWEHIVPASVIGYQKQCWQESGKSDHRKYCASVDKEFALAEGDLINLVPAIGEVNGDRKNYRFASMTNFIPDMYGKCQTFIDFKSRRIQPRREVRGRIARIQFYMSKTYNIKLSDQDKKTMCYWSKQYPVDSWEIIRNNRIKLIQGNTNLFVTDSRAIDAFCN